MKMNFIPSSNGNLLWLTIVTLLIAGSAADVSDIIGNNDHVLSLQQALRGAPGTDFPIYSEAPKTSFSCEDKDFGYYVDTEARCQVFRVCAHTDLTGIGFTFLCPNGTLFNQQFMVCDWYYNVKCEGSDQYYNMNQVLNKKDGNDGQIMKEIKQMMMFPFENPIDPTRFNDRPSQPSVQPFLPPLSGGDIPSFTGNGPTQGVVAGVPTEGGTTPPSFDGDVFVSNLGELSTDPNSSFDQRKSNIIPVSADSDPNATGQQVLTYPDIDGIPGARVGRKKINGDQNLDVSLNTPDGLGGFNNNNGPDIISIGGGRPSSNGLNGDFNRGNINQRLNDGFNSQGPSSNTNGFGPNSGSVGQNGGGFNPNGGSLGQNGGGFSPNGGGLGQNTGGFSPNDGGVGPNGGGFGQNGFNGQGPQNSPVRLSQTSNSFNQGGPTGRNGVIKQKDKNDIFSIIRSVLDDRHGGVPGAQKRLDHPTPQYEIHQSHDLTHDFHFEHGVDLSDLLGGALGGSSSGSGVNVVPAQLLSQSSNRHNTFLKPGSTRRGPNVEVEPVPLRYYTSYTGSEYTDQPYTIPASLGEISARNFVSNYNPLLSPATASTDDVQVEIVQARGTYVNDGNGFVKPITDENASNRRRLPSNYAQTISTSSEVSGVTSTLSGSELLNTASTSYERPPYLSGTPSSYEVPLYSVGPLPDQTGSYADTTAYNPNTYYTTS